MLKTISASVKKFFGSTGSKAESAARAADSDYCLELAQSAWPLTEAALASPGIPDVVDRCHGRRQHGYSQSPLHRIMNVRHSNVAGETRQALENSKEFRQCVAHVFSRVSRESVQKWADAHINHGYFEPLAQTCQWALNEELVGLTPTLVWEETSTGEIGIYEYPV